MTTVRLCLLGAGRWGQRYIQTIGALEGIRLVALASRNPASRGLVAEDCRIFADWRDAVASRDVDAVIVATPPELHRDMTMAAIVAGKPVLVEKPLTLSLDWACEIEQASVERGVMAMVGHTHLFNPAYLRLKEQLGSVGSILALETKAGNWGPFRADVTPLWDWAPHDLSLCLDLLGSSPVSVASDRCNADLVEGGWGGNFRLQMRFPSSVQADVFVGNMMDSKCRHFAVTGTLGSLAWDDVAGTLVRHKDGIAESIPFSPERPLTREVCAFRDAVLAKRSSHDSLRLGREIVEILSSLT